MNRKDFLVKAAKGLSCVPFLSFISPNAKQAKADNLIFGDTNTECEDHWIKQEQAEYELKCIDPYSMVEKAIYNKEYNSLHVYIKPSLTNVPVFRPDKFRIVDGGIELQTPKDKPIILQNPDIDFSRISAIGIYKSIDRF